MEEDFFLTNNGFNMKGDPAGGQKEIKLTQSYLRPILARMNINENLKNLLNVINMEMNCETPRTKQALYNLDLKKDDIFLGKMEDFFQKHESPEVYETRYVNHITQVATNRKNLIKERARIKRFEIEKLKRENRHLSYIDEPSRSVNSINTRPITFEFLTPKYKEERLREKTDEDYRRLQIEAKQILELKDKLHRSESDFFDRIERSERKKIFRNTERLKKIEEQKKINQEKLENVRAAEKDRKKKKIEDFKSKLKDQEQKHMNLAEKKMHEVKKMTDKLETDLNDKQAKKNEIEKNSERKALRLQIQLEEKIRRTEEKRKDLIENISKRLNSRSEIFIDHLEKAHKNEKSDEKNLLGVVHDKLVKIGLKNDKRKKEFKEKSLKNEKNFMERTIKVKSNIQQEERKLREMINLTKEKMAEKFEKFQMNRSVKEENFSKTRSVFKEKYQRISDNYFLLDLENKKKSDKIMEKSKMDFQKVERTREEFDTLIRSKIKHDWDFKHEKALLLETIQSFLPNEDNESKLNKLRNLKLSFSLEDIEKFIISKNPKKPADIKKETSN